ncbi:MAG: FAD-dependent oxidoreductase [Chloroflexota bacterium]
MQNRKRVIIIGAGFAGIKVAKQLARQPIDVLIIAVNN